jgi:hypothetical protein
MCPNKPDCSVDVVEETTMLFCAYAAVESKNERDSTERMERRFFMMMNSWLKRFYHQEISLNNQYAKIFI